MRTNAIPLLLSCFVAFGCARMGTRQGDKSTTTTVYELNDKGRTNSITVTETRDTQTRASGTAFVSSSSSFEGLDASQNGDKQGLKLKKSEQKSDIDKMMDLMDRVTQGAARMYGVQVPPALPAIPDGYKLVPKDDPQPKVNPAPVVYPRLSPEYGQMTNITLTPLLQGTLPQPNSGQK